MSGRLPDGIRRLPSGKYQARYPVTEYGRTVMRSAGTFTTLSDAKDARSVALAARRQGAWVDPAGPRMTVERWMTQWQTLRRVKSTVRLRSFLKVHILPTFGACRLGEITPVDVQRWVNDMSDVKKLSPITVQAIYGTFRQAMAAAVDLDLLVRSPCRAIVLPKVRRSKPTALTVEQVRALEASAPPKYRAMLHLQAWAGLRWQEAAALRWCNVDLAAGVVHVREAVKADDHEIGLPKNGKERTVPLAPASVAVLTAHRRDFGGHELLFPNRYGTRHLDYGSFRVNVWYPLCKRLGLDPRPSTHDLRHFYATTMVGAGIDPKVLSDAMGHFAPSFTMDRYGLARADSASVLGAAVELALTTTEETR